MSERGNRRAEIGMGALAVAWSLAGCVDPTPPDEGGATHYQSGVPVVSWNQAGSGGLPFEPVAGAAGVQPPMGTGGAGGGGVGGTGGVGGSSSDGGVAGTSGVGGTGGVTGTGGTGGTGGAAPPAGLLGGVTLDFTTADQGGRYAPDNVGAAWVADANGKWVKTLERWAWIRGQYLSKYNAANPGNNLVDAVTSATKGNHGTHHLTWNLTDANRAKVAPGNYTIFIECTEREDKPGEWTQIDFTVGDTPATVSNPDSAFYKSVSLKYE